MQFLTGESIRKYTDYFKKDGSFEVKRTVLFCTS